MMADLQSLSCALLESLNDKNVALSHQRKTNKLVTLETIIRLPIMQICDQIHLVPDSGVD